MESKELRIGNFVQHNSELGKVNSIVLSLANVSTYTVTIFNSEQTPSTVKYEECEPIPLSEEWLEKFGFEIIEGEWCQDFLLVSSLVEDGSFYYNGAYDVVVGLEFVHELQNLYYVLHGRDLLLEI